MAHITDRAGSGRCVFDKGRFGVEGSGHDALSGKHRLAPLRLEVSRSFVEVVSQKNLMRWSTLEGDSIKNLMSVFHGLLDD